MSEVPVVPGRPGLAASPAAAASTGGTEPAAAGTAARLPSTPLGERVSQVFAPGGVLARTLTDFEPRTSQVEMADAVAHVFDNGGVLLAEAGTGTGKTLAYLVPAILSGQRVLVSTGTKNLQEQIFFKDIPLLRDALGVSFSAAYMKGRANYLCLHRLDQALGEAQSPVDGTSTPGPWSNTGGRRRGTMPRRPRDRAGSRLADSGSFGDSVFLPIIRDWAKQTDTGDRAELDLPEDLAAWNDVSASVETCIGTECPRYDECFVTRMRQRAAESDLVVVNHHLLCADAAVRQNAYGEVIPSCAYAVIDEAHQLEDVATQYFGVALSPYRLEDLTRDVERSATLIDERHRLDLPQALGGLRDASTEWFRTLAEALRTGGYATARADERMRVTADRLVAAADQAATLAGALATLEAMLTLAAGGGDAIAGAAGDVERALSAHAGEEAFRSLARRAGALRDDLRFLTRADDPRFVYFIEFRGKAVFLRAAPIDVAEIVRELLLDRMQTTVLTSATLSVDASFDYIRSRLGIRDASEIRLPSEFDYTKQAILYLPPRMPDPRSEQFAVAAGREVVEILKRTRGRAFVLFTSYATLRAVQAIAEMTLEYPILVQGTAPRSQLLRQFRETPHAVLLATSSFWQGVDVVGEALSCVIVDKLPFASPADPVTSARIDAIRARGGEPFGDYQVPLAILSLQQGLGRLIRHRADRGVLAVLDPRLRTKGYGRRFLASLPPAPVVHALDAVEAFFPIV